jgi:hypothetical protein
VQRPFRRVLARGTGAPALHARTYLVASAVGPFKRDRILRFAEFMADT